MPEIPLAWVTPGQLHEDAVNAILYWRSGRSWAAVPQQLAKELMDNAVLIWKAYNAVHPHQPLDLQTMSLAYAATLKRELGV